ARRRAGRRLSKRETMVSSESSANGSGGLDRLFHVAIIMDGNGRWATARGLTRAEGHRRGAHAVPRTVPAAPALGIPTLTLFAFFSHNWRGPHREVQTLLPLFGEYLHSEQRELRSNGVRLSVIGRRDRLPRALTAAMEACEAATAGGSRLHLQLAIDYSARNEILRAAGSFGPESQPSAELFRKRLESAGGAEAPDVDLLIRTGGECRLSDFLLWESAYAELYFMTRMWPDFRAADLAAA